MKRIVIIGLVITLVLIAALVSYIMFRPQLQSTTLPESSTPSEGSTPQEIPRPTPEEQGITPKQILEMVFAQVHSPVDFTNTGGMVKIPKLEGEKIKMTERVVVGMPLIEFYIYVFDPSKSWSVYNQWGYGGKEGKLIRTIEYKEFGVFISFNFPEAKDQSSLKILANEIIGHTISLEGKITDVVLFEFPRQVNAQPYHARVNIEVESYHIVK